MKFLCRQVDTKELFENGLWMFYALDVEFVDNCRLEVSQ